MLETPMKPRSFCDAVVGFLALLNCQKNTKYQLNGGGRVIIRNNKIIKKNGKKKDKSK